MHRNKFKMGDKVKVIAGENAGNEYQVIAVTEQAVNNMFANPNYIDFGTSLEYRYRLKSISDGSTKYFDEAELEIIPKSEKEVLMEQFSEYVNQVERIPAYKIGDVVTIPEASSTRTYVIRESIDYGPSTGIVYEMFAPDNTERIIQFAESALEFQYHDVSWEYHLESYENGLPLWRGKLYNLYQICTNPDDFDNINSYEKDYINDTLPPKRMIHILTMHSIYSRINNVIGSLAGDRKTTNRKEIMKTLHIDDDDQLNRISTAVKEKILAINRTDIDQDKLTKFKDTITPDFTYDEKLFISEVDRLDTSNKKIKDHYPAIMTNLQIMDVIKNAYENAHKAGPRRIYPETSADGIELAAPVRGKMKYQGHSKKYDMDIEFWYNFDLNIIETAYPIRMNNNAKKH